MLRRGPRSLKLAAVVLLMSLVGTLGAQAQSDSSANAPGPDREWRFIEQLRADGMLDVAATQLQQFARNYPDDARAAAAWLRAGRIHEDLGQPQAARQDYESLLAALPSSDEAPQAALRRAEILNDAKDFEEAVKAYRSLLQGYPAAPQVDAARLGLGEALMARGDDGAARSMLRLLVAGRADNDLAARARYDLGVLAERADSDSLAVERFDSVARLHPDQPIAGFALLRSAEILGAKEQIAAASERYRRLLELDTAPVLRGRARMGLAKLLRQRDPKAAMDQYEALAAEGASAEQVQSSLLELADLALEQSDRKRARRAAETFLETFPEAPTRARAQLAAARADLGERDDAVGRLTQLTTGEDRDVAHEAALSLGQWFSSAKKSREALAAFRVAESNAPDDDARASAQMRQAEVALVLGESALAADLAERAALTSPEAPTAAPSRLLAVRALDDAGRRVSAIAAAKSLIQELPLTRAATEARRLLRAMLRQANFDPTAAAKELAELAATPIEDHAQRRIAVGTILRERLGDSAAALTSFRAAAKAAQTPSVRAQASLEIARTLRQEALGLGLRGDTDEARQRLAAARAALADAAAIAGAESFAATARIELIGLDLSDAAQPEAPWLFDADHMPLLGAVGGAEAINRSSGALASTRQRIETALEGELTDPQRAWLVWRAVELSTASTEQRQQRLEQALQLRLGETRELELRYALGQLMLESRDAVGAASQLNRIVDRAPASDLAVAARYGLAEAHRGQKNYGVAADLYLDFANAYPQSVRGQRALLLAGDCGLLSGDAETAVARYRSLLERYPDTVYRDDALYRLGTALQRDGRADAAREALGQLIEFGDTSDYQGRALSRLAKLESDAGRDSVAIVVLERLQSVDPARAAEESASSTIARLQVQRGNFEQALASLPDSSRGVQARAIRVRALSGAGRQAAALKEWEALRVAAVDAAPLLRQLRCELGEKEAESGDTEAAATSFDFVIAEARSGELLARAHYQRGVLAARARDLDRARAELEAASRQQPTSSWTADALYQLGSLQVREGQPDLAQKSFERVAEEFPRHDKAAAAISAEALALRRMSRYDQALERYHQLLERYPEYEKAAQVLSNIAYCHHELHQYEVAVQAYRRVMPYLDEEGQAYAEFWIADSLAGLERYEEAAAAFLRIPYLYPKQGQLPVTAQLKAAEVYERMQNVDAATTIYEKVLRTHGANSQWGSEAQRRLERLTNEQRDAG